LLSGRCIKAGVDKVVKARVAGAWKQMDGDGGMC